MFFITAKSGPTVWPDTEMQGMTMALIFCIFAKRYANSSAMHSIHVANGKGVSERVTGRSQGHVEHFSQESISEYIQYNLYNTAKVVH